MFSSFLHTHSSSFCSACLCWFSLLLHSPAFLRKCLRLCSSNQLFHSVGFHLLKCHASLKTPKFVFLALTSPLSSTLIYQTACWLSVFIHSKHLTSKCPKELLIFAPLTSPELFPNSVNDILIHPAIRSKL